MTDEELHRDQSHPEYLYRLAPNYPDSMDGWTGNRHLAPPDGRVWYGGQQSIYWMRRKDAPQQKRHYRKYHPATHADLLIEAGIRPTPDT